jgi:hypothetical protein
MVHIIIIKSIACGNIAPPLVGSFMNTTSCSQPLSLPPLLVVMSPLIFLTFFPFHVQPGYSGLSPIAPYIQLVMSKLPWFMY